MKKLTVAKAEEKYADSITKYIPNFDSLSIDNLWQSEPKIHGKYSPFLLHRVHGQFSLIHSLFHYRIVQQSALGN